MLELMTKFFIEKEPTGRTEKGKNSDSFGSELSAGSKNVVKSHQPANNGDKYLTSLARPTTAALTSRRGSCISSILWQSVSVTVCLSLPACLCLSFSFPSCFSVSLTGSLSLSLSLFHCFCPSLSSPVFLCLWLCFSVFFSGSLGLCSVSHMCLCLSTFVCLSVCLSVLEFSACWINPYHSFQIYTCCAWLP